MARTRVDFKLSGLDQYLENIQKSGANMEEAVAEALTESAKPIYEDIKKWAEKHKRTGIALKGVDQSEVQKDGYNMFVEVGVSSEKSKGAWHIAFVEYGTPRKDADPGIQKAFKKNRTKAKRIQEEILRKAGVPID
jgi:HK97 gp10 family phage protein